MSERVIEALLAAGLSRKAAEAAARAGAKAQTREALHSSEDDDHGTPSEYIELARFTLGAIDLDPSSSAYWNHHTVKAERYYDERMDFTKQPLYRRVFWNPPSGKALYQGRELALPRIAWRRLFEHWRDGRVHSAVWLGFSMEQLTALQGEAAHPLQFITLFPCERLKFLKRGPNGGPPEKGEQPVHGNYVTLLHTLHSPSVAKEQVQRFCEYARRLDVGGAIVRPLV